MGLVAGFGFCFYPNPYLSPLTILNLNPNQNPNLIHRLTNYIQSPMLPIKINNSTFFDQRLLKLIKRLY